MVGATISHYTILEKLGEGGMGVVYKAQDTKLNRFVALKFLPSELLRNEDAKQRFVREAQTISALQHNNICTIHEIDETDEGQLFIAMDLYEGKPLDEVIAKGGLESDRLINVARQIAQGLAAAHAKGITHRDIKPANIFLTSDNTVKILDFGLAKLADARVSLTKEGSTTGTAAYMSPEQVRGDEVDPRSDIFSFGIVLYELITGQRPFRGTHDAALAYEIVNADPSPLNDLGKAIPLQLQHVVNKALAKDPGGRYQKAVEILDDLEKLSHDTISRESPGWIPTRMRSSMGAIIAAVLIVGVAAGVIYLSFKTRGSSSDVKSLAILFMKNLGDEPDNAYCYGMTQDLIVDLSNVGRVRVAPLKNVMSIADSTTTIESIGKMLRVQYVMESSFRREGEIVRVTANIIDATNGTIVWGNRFQANNKEASSIHGDIIQSILTHFEIPPESRVNREITSRRTTNPEAYEYYLRAQYIFAKKKSEQDIVIARGMLENAIKLDSSFVAALIQLGYTYSVQSEFEPAQKTFERALAVARSSGKKLDEAASLSQIGTIYWYRRMMSEALDFHQQSLKIYVDLEHLPGQAQALNGMAIIYSNQGNSDNALATYNRALEIFRMLGARRDEATLTGNIGIEYMTRGDFTDAIESLKESIVLFEELENVAEVGRYTFNLGELYRRIGDTENAMQQLDRSLEINRRLGVKFGEIICIGAKGMAYSDQERFAIAIEHLDSAIVMGRQLGSPYLESGLKIALGLCYVRKGEFHRSEEPLKSAVSTFSGTGEIPMIIWGSSWLGLAQMKMGQKEAAMKTAEQVRQMLSSNPTTDEDVQVFWNLSQVYSLAGNQDEASEYLERSHLAMSTRAARIKDTRMRAMYLENVIEHREINAEWEKTAVR